MNLSLLRQVFFTTFVVGTMATIELVRVYLNRPHLSLRLRNLTLSTTPEGVVIRPYEREEIKRQSCKWWCHNKVYNKN